MTEITKKYTQTKYITSDIVFCFSVRKLTFYELHSNYVLIDGNSCKKCND